MLTHIYELLFKMWRKIADINEESLTLINVEKIKKNIKKNLPIGMSSSSL